MESQKAAEILLVEDNPGDVELIREALADGKLLNRITLATDGEEAISLLTGGRGYGAVIRPDLVLLDLNIPRKDGFEVLHAIKRDPLLSRVPVIILTSSQADRDILKSYDLRANCFVTKPVEVDDFLHVVRSTGEFWLSIVKLPMT